MKLVYRVLILLVIFIGSLFYFGSNMVEAVFSIEKETMDMSEASLPHINFRVGDKDYNLLHGYGSGLDAQTIRESITPLTTEQTFSIVITENESVVKKLKYEITPLSGSGIIEEGSVNALDKEDSVKLARVNIKAPLEKDTDYVFKVTLITDQSKRIYYYTRIKVLSNGYISEKINFVQEFHKSILNKETAENISRYLETKKNADSTTYAYVNINSSLDMVSYGTLSKSVIVEQVPTITEISNDQASIVLTFVLKVDTSSGTEFYNVKEYYRFSYTTNRVYLYNYERTMQAIFDVSLTSLSESEFKLGITQKPEIDFVTNSDNSIVAFVWNRELYSYSLSENRFVRVFSFEQNNTDYIRDTYNKHDVKIVSMDEAGNLTFMVYGYMNRGEYEGRVAIILYTYDRVLERIEEKMYIPVNSTFEILKEEVGDFVYRNDFNVLYFTIYDTIYSYNLSTEALKVIAENINLDQLVFSKENQYIAWQDNIKTEENQILHVLQLEEGKMTKIVAADIDRIGIVGSIDGNIIYGLTKMTDITVRSDGAPFIPMYQIIISDYTGNILKSYSKDGVYTTDVAVSDNVVELTQAVKSNQTALGFEEKESDFILNKAVTKAAVFGISKRVTELMLTEYYISLTAGHVMEGLPESQQTKNTVITKDTTVRINQPNKNNLYYTYSFGDVLLVSEQPGDAITLADDRVGVVIDQFGRKIWERGAKLKKAQLNNITSVYTDNGLDSIQASIRMVLSYKNVNINTSNYLKQEASIEEYLSKYLKATPLNMKGITLDQALYYVSKGSPVIAFKNEDKAVVIVGYDSSTITVIDPSEHTTKTLNLSEASELFEKNGNVYISYTE